MKHTQIADYIEDKKERGLEKIDFSLVAESDTTSGDFYIVKTKETYKFYDEPEADAMINEVRTLNGFIGVDKKYKQGKVNKAGEVTVPESWTVVVKLNH